MRNPKRIKKVLKAIEEVWELYPDMRLGQLICNVYRDPILYYIEDKELVEALQEVYLPEPTIVYGKRKLEDGSYVEDKNLIARKFGDSVQACFICKKATTCTARTIKDCKPDKHDNIVCASGDDVWKD